MTRNREFDIALENLENIMLANSVDSIETDPLNEAEEAFIYAVVEAVSDPDYMTMCIRTGIADIRENPQYAMEGATKESIKALFSDDLKAAKEQLRDATKAAKSGNTEEAAASIKEARAKFVKVHEELAKVKQGPVSALTAGFASMVISPIATFKSLTGMSPAGKAFLISRQVANAIANLASLIPGVGIMVRAMLRTMSAAASGFVGGSEIGMMLANKLPNAKKDPDSETSEKLSNKAGFWNLCQREMLYILKAYINTCDGILKDIKSGKFNAKGKEE